MYRSAAQLLTQHLNAAPRAAAHRTVRAFNERPYEPGLLPGGIERALQQLVGGSTMADVLVCAKLRVPSSRAGRVWDEYSSLLPAPYIPGCTPLGDGPLIVGGCALRLCLSGCQRVRECVCGCVAVCGCVWLCNCDATFMLRRVPANLGTATARCAPCRAVPGIPRARRPGCACPCRRPS